MSNRFSAGMFTAIGLVLAVFTAGWIVGFVELVRHIEGLRHDVISAAGAALGISYAVVFVSWWLWFIYFFDSALDDKWKVRRPGVFTFLTFTLALFTGGWFGGFLTLNHYIEAMTHGSVVGAGFALGLLGISILFWWIAWFVGGFASLFNRD